MGLLSLFKSKPTIGLDIGSRMVKVVQLKKNGTQIELEKFGVAEIYPDGEKPKNPEVQKQATVEAIKLALQNAHIDSNTAVTAVAGEAIIVRYINLPSMSEAELKNAIKWEAEEYIPFPVEEVNIDSSIVGQAGEGENAQMEVLLVCARKDHISDHVSLVQQAGLMPTCVDVDSFAFLNCYELNYESDPDEVVALVNIGGEISSISVYSDGTPRFSRDISIGGGTITTSLMQRLDLSYEEAEKVKLEHGAPGGQPEEEGPGMAESADSEVMDTIRSTVASMTGEGVQQELSPAERAIRNTLNSLISEIRRSIQFYENQSGGKHVSQLVLGGGCSTMRNLAGYLADELKLPVEIIDPLRRVPVTGSDLDADFLRESKHMLSVGIGLAMRKVVD